MYSVLFLFGPTYLELIASSQLEKICCALGRWSRYRIHADRLRPIRTTTPRQVRERLTVFLLYGPDFVGLKHLSSRSLARQFLGERECLQNTL
jgi:hypothetical protein